jgi:hypothetical protein
VIRLRHATPDDVDSVLALLTHEDAEPFLVDDRALREDLAE